MKRPDELAVVAKAHEQPRFVEDCVREMVRRVVEGYPELPGEAFVMARQENLETIHRHNVVAERYGTLADLRAELESGEHRRQHLSLREWLEGPSVGAEKNPTAIAAD
jgi:GTP cyclohydrolase-4